MDNGARLFQTTYLIIAAVLIAAFVISVEAQVIKIGEEPHVIQVSGGNYIVDLDNQETPTIDLSLLALKTAYEERSRDRANSPRNADEIKTQLKDRTNLEIQFALEDESTNKYDIFFARDSRNNILMREVSNPQTVSEVYWYGKPKQLLTPVVVADTQITNATIRLQTYGDVKTIVRCESYNQLTQSCKNWEDTDIEFEKHAGYIEFTVTEFSGYGGKGEPGDVGVAETLPQWFDQNPSADIISRRRGGIAYDSDNDVTVYFGGYIAYGTECDNNETWTYNSTANTWTQHTPASVSPGERRDPAMTYDKAANLVILFGGIGDTSCSASEVYHSDTWAYNVTANTWTDLAATNTPEGRWGARLVFDESINASILYGGYAENACDQWTERVCNSTWKYTYSTNTWNQINATTVPDGRTSFGMAYDRRKKVIIMHGGHCDPNANGYTCTGDTIANERTWRYSSANETWTLLTTNTDIKRDRHSIAYDGIEEKIVLYAGRGNLAGSCSGSSCNDTWTFNVDNDTWTQIDPKNATGRRTYIEMTFDEGLGRIIGVGGERGGQRYNDTYTLKIQDKNSNGDSCVHSYECSSGNCINSMYEGSVTSNVCCDVDACVTGSNTCTTDTGTSSTNQCFDGTWIHTEKRLEIQDESTQDIVFVIDAYGSMVAEGSISFTCSEPGTNVFVVDDENDGDTLLTVDNAGNVCFDTSLSSRQTVTAQASNAFEIYSNTSGTVASLDLTGAMSIEGDYSENVASIT